MQQSLIPVPLIEHLAKVMPRDGSGEGYDYAAFLESLVSDGMNGSVVTVVGADHGGVNGVGQGKTDHGGVIGGMARGSKHYL